MTITMTRSCIDAAAVAARDAAIKDNGDGVRRRRRRRRMEGKTNGWSQIAVTDLGGNCGGEDDNVEEDGNHLA